MSQFLGLRNNWSDRRSTHCLFVYVCLFSVVFVLFGNDWSPNMTDKEQIPQIAVFYFIDIWTELRFWYYIWYYLNISTIYWNKTQMCA